MLLGFGESLEGVVGLFAVSLRHFFFLHVLALLLNLLFFCCLHLLSDFTVLSSFLFFYVH